MFAQFQPSYPLLVLFISTAAIYLHSWLGWRARTRGRSLPPGPRGLPLVGNMFNAPKFKPWIAYRDLASTYGSMVHFRIFGQSIMALNTADVIDELLEKRSAITSDRKDSSLVYLSGHDMTLTFFTYGLRWRQHRRLFWQHFTAKATMEYRPVQRVAAQRLLVLLLKDPVNFKEHIRFAISSSILKIIYGIDVVEKDDPHISKVDAALEGLSLGLVPGKYWVEFLPFLRHVPAWVPGAGFQKQFSAWRASALAMKNDTFAYVKPSLDQGGLNCTVLGRLVTSASNLEGWSPEEIEDMVKNVAVVAFEGGADTTFSTLQTVFLAASLYPEVVGKAQAELDAVVGPHRLPDFDDQESLVYVNALIKEALRWQNVTPLSIPHRVIRDDEYHGYFIPEGTLLVPNIWACMHDPEVYADPDKFNPERFIRDGKLDPSIRDPFNFAFGFGRRVCPGRHFAMSTLFINVASILHMFSITPPLDEHGNPIEVVPSMTDGLLSYPEDVRCTIKPRSFEAEQLMMTSLEK